MTKKIPNYWKSSLSDADNEVMNIKRGTVDEFTSAGGRKIYRIFYGEKNLFRRTANLSSAVGAKNKDYFADKKSRSYRPTLLLIGCQHGFEFEGSVALLNIIHAIETGKDYAGNPHNYIKEFLDKINLIIIPYNNPDGRSRVPYETADGLSFEEFRYYDQGTWSDGTLTGWPGCKELHPMAGDRVGFLGAYFNDDGINIVHDLFPFPTAKETKLLFDTVYDYVPDLTIMLHGGTNSNPSILYPEAVHKMYVDKSEKFAKLTIDRMARKGFKLNYHSLDDSTADSLPNYNIASAMTNACGEPCVVFESNQGLDYRGTRLTMDEIYAEHIILFEAALEYTAACRND